MSTKNVRHFLFWTSLACWAIGFIIAVAQQQGNLPRIAALDAVALWGLGAFLGALWLILIVIKLAARTWHHEKAAAELQSRDARY